jgi:hypothetical protein
MNPPPTIRRILSLVLLTLSAVLPASAWYDPGQGRWCSRDPIGENGGVNLYGFVRNDGIGRHDRYGLRDDAVPSEECCCAGKKFDISKKCCIGESVVDARACSIRIYIGHGDDKAAGVNSDFIRKTLSAANGAADRIGVVSCHQQTMNGPAVLQGGKDYPNSNRENDRVWFDWMKDGNEPGPTMQNEVQEEIAAAETEAGRMCNVAESRGLCCKEVRIELFSLDLAGARWIKLFYPKGTLIRTVPCKATCVARGGKMRIPENVRQRMERNNQ